MSSADPRATNVGDGDVVLRSRVRLARNLSAFPFVGRATHSQRREVVEMARAVPLGGGAERPLNWAIMNDLPSLERQQLVERHLVSRQFSEGDAPRAVALAPDETLAIMVNEEDHLRIQGMRAGSALTQAYDDAMALDDALAAHLDFAFCQRLGYLTACPTNVGCGIRVSVMVHLRALRQTGEMERVKTAAKALHLAVRGFYGEGSDAIGDWFQISNQRTLGVREEDLLADFTQRIVPLVVDWERSARRIQLERKRRSVEDRVFRDMAVLRTARMLALDEAMKLLSSVRIGVCTGLLRTATLDQLNDLLIALQPGHLRAAHPGIEGEEDEREARARTARAALGELQP